MLGAHARNNYDDTRPKVEQHDGAWTVLSLLRAVRDGDAPGLPGKQLSGIGKRAGSRPGSSCLLSRVTQERMRKRMSIRASTRHSARGRPDDPSRSRPSELKQKYPGVGGDGRRVVTLHFIACAFG